MCPPCCFPSGVCSSCHSLPSGHPPWRPQVGGLVEMEGMHSNDVEGHHVCSLPIVARSSDNVGFDALAQEAIDTQTVRELWRIRPPLHVPALLHCVGLGCVCLWLGEHR